MNMSESNEMYLETIYCLSEEYEYVRAVDIATTLKITKASVSIALKRLEAAGYVFYNDAGTLELTAEGKKCAKKIFERHTVLTRYLKSIGVKEKTAEEDACRIEHYISDATFKAIKDQLKK